MKWRAHRDKDGVIDQLVVVSDSHTILKVTTSLYLCFRKQKPMAVIIGRWSTPSAARKCCEEDYPGKPYPPDTVGTYPEGSPTLDRASGGAGQEIPQGPVPGDGVPQG